MWPIGRTLSRIEFGLPQLDVAAHLTRGNDFFTFDDRLMADSFEGGGFVSIGRASGEPARRLTPAEIGRGFDARMIAATGVMIGVIFVMTRYITFTIGPGGYLHLGDIGIYVAAFLFGPLVALIAGAAGTALADLSFGYGAWAPGTFVIHGLQAFVAGVIAWRRGMTPMVLAGIIGGAIFVV